MSDNVRKVSDVSDFDTLDQYLEAHPKGDFNKQFIADHFGVSRDSIYRKLKDSTNGKG